ncbi:hypothetical protein GGS23DRAFT_593176 [Durotheca rogersii]|uniref:uncharacterized protein n=1 Tax=Durotheca rogersii TaxID=419775 RepID=UPI00221E663B|nr:uncharacterized protein GGS23DRAFT_593176 [Durotheca rogersii]KAI5866427.1 hypothetical protein GGS23DRAFT_593176 [Durotheca rogersii]
MQRVGLTAIALAALVSAAPITEPADAIQARQFSWTDPSTWLQPGGDRPPITIILPPVTGPLKPSTKRQEGIFLPPITGGLEPSTKKEKRQDFILFPPVTGELKPSTKKRQEDKIGVGIGTPDPVKAHIIALELEYEALLQNFGARPPRPVAERLEQIREELLTKYGIKIIQSPDGTTTTFVPGKRDLGDGEDDTLITLPYLPGTPNPDPVVPGGPIEVSD